MSDLSGTLPPSEGNWRDDWHFLRHSLDRSVLIICLVSIVVLTLQHYFAHYAVISSWLKAWVRAEELEIWGSLSWCASIVLLYALIPMLCIKLLGQRLRDYGLSIRGLHRHWHPYLLFFAVMLLPLLLAARTPAFQQMYPFFKYVGTSWTLFVVWQVAYGLQFAAVEFFFRGFLLFGLAQRLGAYAWLLSTIPYCMIHFAKPLGESLGAIVAGLVLSYLAWKNRSIWGGAALHWAVALTMDLGAILL